MERNIMKKKLEAIDKAVSQLQELQHQMDIIGGNNSKAEFKCLKIMMRYKYGAGGWQSGDYLSTDLFSEGSQTILNCVYASILRKEIESVEAEIKRLEGDPEYLGRDGAK
jgi:hypothetical protein